MGFFDSRGGAAADRILIGNKHALKYYGGKHYMKGSGCHYHNLSQLSTCL